MIVQPGKGSFNDPAPQKDDEALLVIGAKYGLESEATAVGHPIQELASIATVHPDKAELLAGAGQARLGAWRHPGPGLKQQ